MEDRPIRVLLLEDNPGDARLIQEMLIETGSFDLVWVAQLSTGLERLANQGADVVLRDLSLPDSHGMATFERVRNQAPEVPTVVLTGLDDAEIAVQTVQKGAQDYIVKGQMVGEAIVRSIRYAIERKRMETQLLESHRIQAFGELTAGIADNLKNMLTGILVNIELAQEDVSEGSRELLDTATGAGQRVVEIIDQLRFFSRKVDTEKRRLDLCLLIEQVTEFCRSAFDEQWAIVFDKPDKSAFVYGDEVQLKQIFFNLVINARDALKDRPDLDLPPRIVIHVEPDMSDQYVISISDNGVGIEEDIQDRIFEPFFTTKPNDEGIGLGLAVVRDIVEQHKGRIEVESFPGKGSLFGIYLPIVP